MTLITENKPLPVLCTIGTISTQEKVTAEPVLFRSWTKRDSYIPPLDYMKSFNSSVGGNFDSCHGGDCTSTGKPVSGEDGRTSAVGGGKINGGRKRGSRVVLQDFF